MKRGSHQKSTGSCICKEITLKLRTCYEECYWLVCRDMTWRMCCEQSWHKNVTGGRFILRYHEFSFSCPRLLDVLYSAVLLVKLNLICHVASKESRYRPTVLRTECWASRNGLMENYGETSCMKKFMIFFHGYTVHQRYQSFIGQLMHIHSLLKQLKL